MKKETKAVIGTSVTVVAMVFMPRIIGALIYLHIPGLCSDGIVGDWLVGFLAIVVGGIVIGAGSYIIHSIYLTWRDYILE